MKQIIILISLALLGCEAELSQWGAYLTDKPASVTCYSGGKIIYQGKSTGKVFSENSSDGYLFEDAADGKLKEVSGDCIILYD